MLKHIVFDFDGTLADSTEIGLKIIDDLSEKYNIKKFTRQELISINHMPIKDRLKLVGVPLYKIPKLLIEGLSKYRSLINGVIIFEDIPDLIDSLKKQGFILSIISSNNVENIELCLKKYNITSFDNIISANNIFGKDKSLKRFIKDFETNKDEMIYIGDEIRDIEACKKMNIKIISVTWGYDSIELLKNGKPDYICHKPLDILEIIKDFH